MQLMGYDLGCVVEEDYIKNELTNACASQIFEETSTSLDYTGVSGAMLNSLNINSGIMSMFQNANNFGYTIKQGNIGTANAATQKQTNKMVVVTMDNTYLNTATRLSIARTMIHENLHAYFLHQSNTSTDFRQGLQSFAMQNGMGVLADVHHELMRNYVLVMAISLNIWDQTYGNNQNSLDFEYYIAMACAGLLDKDTNLPNDAFVAIAGDKLQDYLKIISDEASNSADAEGEPCTL
jgi:hypothetical protein